MLTEDQKRIISQLSKFEEYITKLNVLFKGKLAELEKHRAIKAVVVEGGETPSISPSLKQQDSLTSLPHSIEQEDHDHL